MMRLLRAGTIVCVVSTQSCLPHVIEDPQPRVTLPPNIQGTPQTDILASAEAEHDRQSYQAPIKLASFREFWTSFNDPALLSLVQNALAHSFQLHASLARIGRARAIAQQLTAARYPQVTLSGSAAMIRAINPVIGSIDVQSAGAALPITYDADLFAKFRSAANASSLEAEASALDWVSLRIVLTADVADAWYEYVFAELQLRLLSEQHKTNSDYLELLEQRASRGLSPQVDAHQQEQLVWQAQSRIEAAKINQNLAAQQLQLLVVQWPQGGFEQLANQMPQALPEPSSPESMRINGKLISMRPDVQAARLRVRAADHDVGAAVADFFPQLSFTFSPGFEWLRVEARDSALQVAGWVYTVGANLELPIFDGFLRAGRKNERQAMLQERIEELNQQTLAALIETRIALLTEQGLRETLLAKSNEFKAATAALRDARERYQLGVTDFIPVLLALQSEQGVALELLSLKRQLVSARIALHRALAGKLPSS